MERNNGRLIKTMIMNTIERNNGMAFKNKDNTMECNNGMACETLLRLLFSRRLRRCLFA